MIILELFENPIKIPVIEIFPSKPQLILHYIMFIVLFYKKEIKHPIYVILEMLTE